MDIHQFLEQQSKEYKSHLENRNKLESAIKYHHQIKVSRMIPRQFKPKILNPVSRAVSLQEEFEKEYNTLFFNHLDKVITQNQVSKELEEGVLQAIINQTIQQLSQLDKPLSEIQQLYHAFIQNNNIPEENIPVELKTKIQISTVVTHNTAVPTTTVSIFTGTYMSAVTASNTPALSSIPRNIRRKRKGVSQPAATKKSKHHFLDKGQLTQQFQT